MPRKPFDAKVTRVYRIMYDIKKAAPIEEADTNNSHSNYNMGPVQPARLFDKYKARLRSISIGFNCSSALSWEQLPANEIKRRVDLYLQYAKKRRKEFYVGVALYGARVLRQRGVAV